MAGLVTVPPFFRKGMMDHNILDAHNSPITVDKVQGIVAFLAHIGKHPATAEMSPDQDYAWYALATTVSMVGKPPGGEQTPIPTRPTMLGIRIVLNPHLLRDRILFKDNEGIVIGAIFGLAQPSVGWWYEKIG